MVQMSCLQGRNRDAHIEDRCVDTGQEVGSDTNWERRVDIYTLPCVKKITSGKLPYSTGSSALCSAMTQMGGVGVSGREGIYVYIQLSHLVVQQKPTQHHKATILQQQQQKIRKETAKAIPFCHLACSSVRVLVTLHPCQHLMVFLFSPLAIIIRCSHVSLLF